jgi:hypothetical protein
VYADRWPDSNGASLAAVQGEVEGEALFVLVTADHVFGEGGLERLLAAAGVAAGRPGWAAAAGPPVAVLAAVTATSALSLGLRVAFLRRPPAPNVGDPS